MKIRHERFSEMKPKHWIYSYSLIIKYVITLIIVVSAMQMLNLIFKNRDLVKWATNHSTLLSIIISILLTLIPMAISAICNNLKKVKKDNIFYRITDLEIHQNKNDDSKILFTLEITSTYTNLFLKLCKVKFEYANVTIKKSAEDLSPFIDWYDYSDQKFQNDYITVSPQNIQKYKLAFILHSSIKTLCQYNITLIFTDNHIFKKTPVAYALPLYNAMDFGCQYYNKYNKLLKVDYLQGIIPDI